MPYIRKCFKCTLFIRIQCQFNDMLLSRSCTIFSVETFQLKSFSRFSYSTIETQIHFTRNSSVLTLFIRWKSTSKNIEQLKVIFFFLHLNCGSLTLCTPFFNDDSVEFSVRFSRSMCVELSLELNLFAYCNFTKHNCV